MRPINIRPSLQVTCPSPAPPCPPVPCALPGTIAGDMRGVNRPTEQSSTAQRGAARCRAVEAGGQVAHDLALQEVLRVALCLLLGAALHARAGLVLQPTARRGQDRTGTGQDRTGQDRTKQDRTGQDRTRRRGATARHGTFGRSVSSYSGSAGRAAESSPSPSPSSRAVEETQRRRQSVCARADAMRCDAM